MGIRYTSCPKKSICCFIINRTEGFCQNFKISVILVRERLNLNFGAKIVEIH